MSVLEKLKALDDQQAKIEQERAKIRPDAEAELLAQARGIIESLNRLGFTYVLIEQGAGKEKKTTGIKRPMKDGPCPICDFKTNPLHDARAHRSQPEGAKKAFNKAELAEKGMTIVR